MANLEERVTGLEGQADNHTRAIDGLRIEIADLRSELRVSVAQLRSEMATRGDIADLRREIGDLRSDTNGRFEVIGAKIDRHFVWLVGIMVTGFITVIGALVGAVYR